MTVYIDPTDATAIAFMNRNIQGPLTMLNLLRFKDIADYSDYTELAPAEPISGRAAYDRYIEHTLPFLQATGGDLVYLGEGGDWFIGPEGEGWDLAMLVRQDSVESFLNFAGDEAYQAGIGHRVAAVADSRILPLADTPTASA